NDYETKSILTVYTLFLSNIASAQPAYHRIWSVKEEGKVDTNAWKNRFIFNDTIYAKDNVGVNNAIKYITMPEGETGIFAQLGSSDNTEILDMHFEDRKSTRLNSSHVKISYAVFCLKKKK